MFVMDRFGDASSGSLAAPPSDWKQELLRRDGDNGAEPLLENHGPQCVAKPSRTVSNKINPTDCVYLAIRTPC